MSGSAGSSGRSAGGEREKKKEKARVSRTSQILWHAHQNDAAAVRKLLEEDRSLVKARDYDNRTPLHVAALHGWIDVAKCLLEYDADVNAQDRWKNTGQNGSHFEQRPLPPPLPNKCDWEIDPNELDFSGSTLIGKGSFGEILRACWRGTPVAIKRILPNLSDDKLVMTQDEVICLEASYPNIVTISRDSLKKTPTCNYYFKVAYDVENTCGSFAVTLYDDFWNVLLVNTSADHLKVGDFGLSKLIRAQQHSHDVYKLTGETGSYRYMAPEVFKHRKYDKKVDVFSFAMILYEMLEGEPPMSNCEPYEAAKYVAEGHRPIFRAKGYTPELRE
ncbi:UNVERIFIED_CONTAM: Serine/threonine-protein kinase STY46 [Sesamum radiatum]|uniref:Serine/threonine-protein kinase STY46 n=1 Tax=Sesamum radiatum TaxID=300843 RepID=A0AAW2N0I8_SESRA